MEENKPKGRLYCFLKGLLAENPTLVLVLGTCPTIAKTDCVFNALGLGLCTALVLIFSNMAISALRRVIPDKVRIPCYILIIAGFVTVIQMLVHAYLPDLYESLGAFIALIVVNCIILGRAEMFASKNGVIDSVLDGAGMGLGFTLALFAMATVREVLGAGQFFGYDLPFFSTYHFPLLQKTFGGFLIFGITIAVVQAATRGKSPARRSFSCEGCPSAAICSGACAGAAEGEKTADKTETVPAADTAAVKNNTAAASTADGNIAPKPAPAGTDGAGNTAPAEDSAGNASDGAAPDAPSGNTDENREEKEDRT